MSKDKDWWKECGLDSSDESSDEEVLLGKVKGKRGKSEVQKFFSDSYEDSVVDADEDSVIGEKPKQHTIRKIRGVHLNKSTNTVEFECAWQGYDKSGDTNEPIETVNIHANESKDISKMFDYT